MTELVPGNSLGFLLVDIARLYRQLFEKTILEAGLELTPGEVRALGYAARYGGSRQATLAEHMGIEPMTLSAYLDRLEARGLITRSVDATDRRAKVIETTADADRVFDDIRPVILDLYQHVTADFEPDEREALDRLLQKLRKNLGQDLSPTLSETDLKQPAPSATS